MISKDFRAFRIENLDNYTPSFGRKDIYRICLIKGNSKIEYSDTSIDLSGTYLFFGNINTPYSWIIESLDQAGYCCLFTEGFLKQTTYIDHTEALSIFDSREVSLYTLTDEKQIADIEFVFKKMIEENNSDYPNRKDLIRSFLNILAHEGRKLMLSNSTVDLHGKKRASQRICSQFLRLLDTQFPVEDKNNPVQLKTVTDFAGRLGVHANYLNRALKNETGKTILKIINDRFITEAKILLQHTDWSVSEISYSLGFEYPAYFSNVFRKFIGSNPKLYRELL
jgi:AraC family transcriptional activator of pobA